MRNTNSQDLIKVLKGFRNGIYYGGKVRILHSLVMTFLFKKINKKQLINIFKLGYQHAKNLGLFVLGYKTSCLILQRIWGKTAINNFISGFVFGGLIFGHKTPVNYQIVLYLLSRIFVALITLGYKKKFHQRWIQSEAPSQRKYSYFVMASLCWGFVMWLFELDKTTLQASLASSMEFLYVQSDRKLTNWRQLIPFYVPGLKSNDKEKQNV